MSAMPINSSAFSREQPRFGVERFDPQRSGSIMQTKNKSNRPMNRTRVLRYAEDMRRGRWLVNGETIIFDSEGNLLNGQHRLQACIESGATFYSAVCYGVARETFGVIDCGRPRSAGDVLSITGTEYCNQLAAGIRMCRCVQLGDASFISNSSNEEVLRFLEENPLIRNSLSVMKLQTATRLLTPRVCIALHFLFSMRDRDQATRFFTDLNEGTELPGSDPVHVLRQIILNTRMREKQRMKLDAFWIAAITVKAWNFRRANASISLLKWTGRGKNPEDFPKVT